MGNVVVDNNVKTSSLWQNLISRVSVWFGSILFSKPSWGALRVIFPNGYTKVLGSKNSKNLAILKLNNFKLFNQIRRRGTLGFASAFMNKDIESDDLTLLFRFFLKNQDMFNKAGRGLIKRAAHDFIYHLSRKNTRAGAKENISEHYDLGNDFYSLWLDKSMTYSSAYFEDENQALEQAQIAKIQKIAEMAEIKQGATIFEIGSGWGGFAQVMAQNSSAIINSISLSKQQLKYAKSRINSLGLENLVNFNFEDYRDSEGQYDHVVSIEMIEAVGEENWQQYFSVVHDLLKPTGIATIQAITINEKNFKHYKNNPDFIQRYIFPGGMLLTKQAMFEQGKKAGLQLEGSENFGMSYAKTLQLWRENFLAQWSKIKQLGFDENFKRKWIYYLSYCEAGFLENIIDVGIYKYRRN